MLLPAFGYNSVCIPTVPDVNHGDEGKLGETRIQIFIGTDGRWSSATAAYLTADVCRRNNLKFLLDCHSHNHTDQYGRHADRQR